MMTKTLTTCVPNPNDFDTVVEWLDKMIEQAKNGYPCANFVYLKVSRTIMNTLSFHPPYTIMTEYKGIPIFSDNEAMLPSEIRLRVKPYGELDRFPNKPTENIIKWYISRSVPEIKNVVYNPPATIIFWTDDTKTVVKCQDGDRYDSEKGLAIAIAKKALGNKGNFNDVFKKWECKEKHDLSENTVNFTQNIVDQFNQSMFKKWDGQPVDKLFEGTTGQEDTNDNI